MLSRKELAGTLYWYEIFFRGQLTGIIVDKKIKGRKKSFFIPRKATEVLRGEKKIECPYYSFCNTVAANPDKFISKIESFDFMEGENGEQLLLKFKPDPDDFLVDDFSCNHCPNRDISQKQSWGELQFLQQKNEAIDKNQELSVKLVIRPVAGLSKK